MVTTADEQEREFKRHLSSEKKHLRKMESAMEDFQSFGGNEQQNQTHDPGSQKQVDRIRELQQSLHDEGITNREQLNRPSRDDEVRLMSDLAKRTARIGESSAENPKLQALATAIVESFRMGKELEAAIRSGSITAMFVALFCAIIVDVVDFADLDMTWFAKVIIKVSIFIILFITLPTFGQIFRKMIIRVLAWGFAIDALPFIGILPIETIATIWAIAIFERKRHELKNTMDELQQLQQNLQLQYQREASRAEREPAAEKA